MNSEPFEVIGAPFDAYVAPVGTAFPAIDEDPTTPWVKIGTSGNLNYMEDGVTVTEAHSLELWRALGSPGPRKAFRSEEETRISLMLADLTLENYAHALNDNPVTTTPPGAGVAGFKSLGLSRGVDVAQMALLVKGAGPYGADWPAQYELPRCVQAGEPEVVLRRDEPASLALEWVALEDLLASDARERFGRLIAQNAEPTT